MFSLDVLGLVLEFLIVIMIGWEIYHEMTKERAANKALTKTLQKEKKLDLGCDYCEEVKQTYVTPDGLFYLCKHCLEAYFQEHPEITDEHKEKVRKKYKINRATKRRRRKA